MTRLPRVNGKDVVKALERVGFRIERTRGSHVFLKHPDGRATSVPVHSRETIGPGLMRAILREVELTIQEFTEAL